MVNNNVKLSIYKDVSLWNLKPIRERDACKNNPDVLTIDEYS